MALVTGPSVTPRETRMNVFYPLERCTIWYDERPLLSDEQQERAFFQI